MRVWELKNRYGEQGKRWREMEEDVDEAKVEMEDMEHCFLILGRADDDPVLGFFVQVKI